jgi:hypothetical protein
MTQRLHLVFGGELTAPTRPNSSISKAIHVVGMFPDFASAHRAWRAEAQRTVDQATTRYFIAHLHRLLDEGDEHSPTRPVEV